MRASVVGGVVLAIGGSLLFASLSAPALAGDPAPFTEEAVQRGINYPIQVRSTFGSGLAFADLDNDGDPDLVVLGRAVGGAGSNIGLYENDGRGSFTSRVAGSGMPMRNEASGVTAADFDADGDLDIHISCFLEAHCLMRNDGDFVFTDVTAAMGVSDVGAGQGGGWGDFDGDTWLDLYMANRTGTNLPTPPFPPSEIENRLWRNNGGAGFTDVARALGVDSDDDRSFQGSFFDYDRDGDPDLYLANDKGASSSCQYRNRLWRNDRGQFVDISAASGTDGCIDAMSVTLGDFDGNRFQDIYVTNIPAGNPLYLNDGNGLTFTESSVLAGVAEFQVGWGAVFFDYDNDTHMDLFLCNMSEPDRLFDYNGTWPVTDVGQALGVAGPADDSETFCVAVADIDNDGDLDFAVSGRRGPTPGSTSRLRLYINHEGERHNWAKFRVIGIGANTWGVGANVDVRTGGDWRIREVIAGSAFKSQDDLVLHFGLGAAAAMDEIRVRWPGTTQRTLRNFAANRTWTLYPPSRLGDVDGNGIVNAADFPRLVGCYTGDAPGALTPGCEMMDYDGDADVDSADVDAFIGRYADPLADCDSSGVVDLREIVTGVSSDFNGNAQTDRCEGLGDVNCDGRTDFFDIDPFLLALFDPTGYVQQFPGCAIARADTDGDAAVAFSDASNLLALIFWE